MNKINLKNVTAVCLEGRSEDWIGYEDFKKRMKVTLTYMKTFFDLNEIIFISTFDPDVEGVRYIKTNPLTFLEYNLWCIKELDNYFNSDFCFLFQDDGFPLNPNLWKNEFFNYDYVGAPVKIGQLDYIGEEQIGGGGFTLRSKKFTQYIKNKPCDGVSYEDRFCVTTLIKEKNISGLRLAPHYVARHFVIQNELDENHTIYNSFGHHGRFGNRLDIIVDIMKEKLKGMEIYL